MKKIVQVIAAIFYVSVLKKAPNLLDTSDVTTFLFMFTMVKEKGLMKNVESLSELLEELHVSTNLILPLKFVNLPFMLNLATTGKVRDLTWS